MEKQPDIFYLRQLSVDGHLATAFPKAAAHVLNFHRTIVPKKDREKLARYFREIKIQVDWVDILRYPNYVDGLQRAHRNPFEFAVVHVRKGQAVPALNVPTWITRAKNFF